MHTVIQGTIVWMLRVTINGITELYNRFTETVRKPAVVTDTERVDSATTVARTRVASSPLRVIRLLLSNEHDVTHHASRPYHLMARTVAHWRRSEKVKARGNCGETGTDYWGWGKGATCKSVGFLL